MLSSWSYHSPMRRILLLSCMVIAACSPPLAEDASGPAVYESRCASCHGVGLEGGVGPALGAGSELADKPDEYVVNSIVNGRGRMPAFRASLSDVQIERVVDYLRTEQGR